LSWLLNALLYGDVMRMARTEAHGNEPARRTK